MPVTRATHTRGTGGGQTNTIRSNCEVRPVRVSRVCPGQLVPAPPGVFLPVTDFHFVCPLSLVRLDKRPGGISRRDPAILCISAARARTPTLNKAECAAE